MSQPLWRITPLVLLFVLAPRIAAAQAVVAAPPEVQTIANATRVLQEFTTYQIQSIPQGMLRDAQGVVIIPSVIKVGFLIAGRYGRGVAMIRTPEGNWRVPTFVTFAGGSFGWQAGVQSTDVVLIFKNRRGIETLLSGSKFTLGADAAIAAGPVGRQAATGTDLQLSAEIFSYSRSRGLFAGVSLDGSILQTDNRANQAYYVGGAVPQPALQLASLMASDTAIAAANFARNPAMLASATQPINNRESTRRALVDSNRQLNGSLDQTWRAYLALPESVQTGAASATEVNAVVDKYARVQADPQYQSIAQLPQFQSTMALLKGYAATSPQDAAQTAAASGGNRLR